MSAEETRTNYGARGIQRARLIKKAAEKEVAETAQRAQAAQADLKAAEAALKKANNEQNKAAVAEARQAAEAAQAEAQKAADDLARIENKEIQDELQSDDWDEVMDQIKRNCGEGAIQDGVIKSCGKLRRFNCAGPTPDANIRMSASKADEINKNNGAKVDFNELAQYEGGQATSAYVPWWPKNVKIEKGAIVLDTRTENNTSPKLAGASASGVTIGTGVDLGQQRPKEYFDRLKAAGASQALIDKLKPYMGLKRAEACKYLRANPLTITREEADLIDQEMKDYHLKETQKKYDDLTKGIKDRREFKDLSEEEQTVLFSRHYQDGNIHKTHTQYVARDMAEGNTTDAVGRLTTGNYRSDAHNPRIIKEQNYLRAGYAAAAKAAEEKAAAEAAAAAGDGK